MINTSLRDAARVAWDEENQRARQARIDQEFEDRKHRYMLIKQFLMDLGVGEEEIRGASATERHATDGQAVIVCSAIMFGGEWGDEGFEIFVIYDAQCPRCHRSMWARVRDLVDIGRVISEDAHPRCRCDRPTDYRLPSARLVEAMIEAIQDYKGSKI